MVYFSNGDRLEIQQQDVLIHLYGKRSVLCTSPLSGGINRNLTTVFNHCDKDPVTGRCDMLGDTYEKHLEIVARKNGLQPDKTAGLSTACRMDVMKTASKVVNGITITACVTGGITKNGRCVGDPTTLWEENGIFKVLQDVDSSMPTAATTNALQKKHGLIPPSGTINIILHLDANLTDSALLGCMMLLTETKVSKIHEMGLMSCYSEKLATGSGTDGIIIIADAESDRKITQIRTDTKLGECISQVASQALEEMLAHSLREEVSA